MIVGFYITFGNIVAAGAMHVTEFLEKVLVRMYIRLFYFSVLAWIIIPQTWSIVLWDGAFVYNPWRLFLSACGVPILMGVVCLSLFPESPKFLMSQGRMEDALKVFQTIYSTNTGKSKDEYPVRISEWQLPEMSDRFPKQFTLIELVYSRYNT